MTAANQGKAKAPATGLFLCAQIFWYAAPMPSDAKQALLYFSAPTMRRLYSEMTKSGKHFLSFAIQRDGNEFCCIALAESVSNIRRPKLPKLKFHKPSGRFLVALPTGKGKYEYVYFGKDRAAAERDYKTLITNTFGHS